LSEELENEKKEKIRLQAFQNQLLIAQEEKFQLRNEVIHSIIAFTELIYFSSSSLIIPSYIMKN
jgi:hypothetical protein